MTQGLQDRLKTRCDAVGMSFRSVSLAAGLKDGVVVDIVTGKSKEPSAERLFKICQVIKCRLEWLLTGDGPISDEPSQDLSPRDIALLGLFHGLSPEQQEAFYKAAAALAQPGDRDGAEKKTG